MTASTAPSSASRREVDTPPGDAAAYRDAHPSRAVLIVEIADGSHRLDREYKASLYARAGIPDSWIIDLVRDALEVHRDPETSVEVPCDCRYSNV